MDGIADVGSVSVLVERRRWPLEVDSGSILADAATVRASGAVQAPHW
jgi:hypothetical protein